MIFQDSFSGLKWIDFFVVKDGALPSEVYSHYLCGLRTYCFLIRGPLVNRGNTSSWLQAFQNLSGWAQETRTRVPACRLPVAAHVSTGLLGCDVFRCLSFLSSGHVRDPCVREGSPSESSPS